MLKKTKTLLLGALVLPAFFAVGCGHSHELSKVDAVASTCTTAGNSVYYACECGEYFSDAEGKNAIEKDSWVIAATGHTDTNHDNICDTCRDGEVIRVGEDSYKTLARAIERASAGATLVLMDDITLSEGVVITKELTIDLNGKTISAAATQPNTGLIQVETGGKLTIGGEGTVNSASSGNDYSIALWARNGGEIIINGGTYTNVGAFDGTLESPNNNELIYASGNGSLITINGGTFIGNTENEKWGTRYTLNLYDGHRAVCSIVVKGGSYTDFNPADNLAEGEDTNFVADGYKVVEANGIYTVVPNTQA